MKTIGSYTRRIGLVLGLMCCCFGDTAVCSVTSGPGAGSVPSAVQIGVERNVLKVGEPLLVKVSYVWPQPLIHEITDAVIGEIDHNLNVRVMQESENGLITRSGIGLLRFFKLEEPGGRTYSDRMMLFYDFAQSRLVFDKPGSYVLQASGWTRTSKPVHVEIKSPGEVEKRALELLSEPNAYYFLEYGKGYAGGLVEKEKNLRMKGIETLKEVFDRCGDSTVGKWAGARVGIELVKELARRYTLGEEFMRAYRAGKVKEPLVEEAYACLSAALELPDDFPLREEALLNMISLEIVGGNYENCLTYADELAAKYPAGEFGREAAEIRSEIERLKTEQSDGNQPTDRPAQDEDVARRTTLGVVVGGIGVAIAAGIVLVVLLRKKPRAK